MKKKSSIILLLTVLFVSIGQFALTLYLPALPAIREHFHTSSGTIQSTVTIFLLAFGVSQLVYGFLSDRYGRKKCLLVGLGIIILSTILLVAAPNSLPVFYISRFCQGLGAGAAGVIARAVIRDWFESDQLTFAFSILVMAASISPAIAPFIGGWIQHVLGWKMIFYFLIVYTLCITVLVSLFMPETLKKELSEQKQPASILSSIKTLARHDYYLFCVGVIVFSYSCQILYLSICPFIFEQQFHVKPNTYGSLILIPAAGYFLGNLLVNRLGNRFTPLKLAITGLLIMLIASVLLGLIGMMHVNDALYWAILLLFIMTTGIGLSFTSTVAFSLKPFAKIAGSAAAISGLFQMIGTFLVNLVVNTLHLQTLSGLGISLTVCALLGFLFLVRAAQKSTRRHA